MNALPITHLLACATCMVDRASTTFMAEQSAIVFMLAVVFAMLGTLVLIFIHFARKARRAGGSDS